MLYHITYLKNLETIASQGLRADRASNFWGFYKNHSKGYLFLTDWKGVSFWYNLLLNRAEQISDNPLLEGLIPLVLRVDSRGLELEDDPEGSRDSGSRSYLVEDSIPFSRIEYWDGSSYQSISSFDYDTIFDFAFAEADPEQEDGEVFYWYEGKGLEPKKASQNRIVMRYLRG